MANKLYVGNLSYSTDEAELQGIFSQYGEVASVNIITDKMTGRARGFGFVEMATAEGSKAAIEAVNGMEVRGRQLRVNEALEQNRERSGGGGGGGRPRGGNGGGYGGGYRDQY
jgi:RNA recognition motif-containing protein